MAKRTRLSPVALQLGSLADDAFAAGNKEQCMRAIALLYDLYSQELPIDPSMMCALSVFNFSQTD